MHFSYLVKLIRVSNDVVDVGEAPIVPGLASCENHLCVCSTAPKLKFYRRNDLCDANFKVYLPKIQAIRIFNVRNCLGQVKK